MLFKCPENTNCWKEETGTALKGKGEACLKRGVKHRVTACSEGRQKQRSCSGRRTSFSNQLFTTFLPTYQSANVPSNPAPTHVSRPPSPGPGPPPAPSRWLPGEGCPPRGTHSSPHRHKPAAEVHPQPYRKNHSRPKDNGSRFLLLFCTLLPQSSSVFLKSPPAGRRQTPRAGVLPAATRTPGREPKPGGSGSAPRVPGGQGSPWGAQHRRLRGC